MTDARRRTIPEEALMSDATTDSPADAPADVPRRTALHDVHVAAGATLTDFAGWLMPLRYSSELAEHLAVRSAAGLFDLSHMGVLNVVGPGAAELLDRTVVGAPSALAPGRARYSMVCQDDGAVLDDVVVYRVHELDFVVVANASNAAVVLAALEATKAAHPGLDVDVHESTHLGALLAVQGPRAEEIVTALADDPDPVRALPYYAATSAFLVGVPTYLARTGYTGEDGFEIFLDAAEAPQMWARLLAVGEPLGLVPAGLAARDSLRLEAGMPLYGHEIDRTTTPHDAGLGRVVRLDKTGPDGELLDFPGRAALAARKASPPSRVLVGLAGQSRRAARAGYPVVRGTDRADLVVGHVTSGAPSPTLGHPIAMAYVTPEVSAEGTELAVDVRGRAEPVRVVPLPFYRRPAR